MDRLEFEDYEELAESISDEYDSLDNEYGEVTIIAKYNDAKEIIKELACIGYSIEGVELHRPEWDNYEDEYSISLNFDGIWCSPMKYNDKYMQENAKTIYIMDNCSSAIIPYCNGEEIYEVSVNVSNEDDELEEDSKIKHEYMVNGEVVDKATFNDYVSQFAPDLVNAENDEENDILEDDEENISENNDNNDTDNTSSSSITIKINVDTDEVEKFFKEDMRKKIKREMDNMDNLINMLHRPYPYLYERPLPMRFFW